MKKKNPLSERYAAATSLIANRAFKFNTNEGLKEYKAAYIQFNRSIDCAKVLSWIQCIKSERYVEDYPILIILGAEFAVKYPNIAMVDAAGKEIPESSRQDYAVFVDGQHRGQAFMKMIALKEYDAPIPGVVVKHNVADIPAFLCAINPGTSWSSKDKGQVVALTAPEQYKDLCAFINSMVRAGMNRSTASYTVMGKSITSKQIDMLLSGQMPKNKIHYNLAKGMRFIDLCMAAGITMKYLSKRYFVEGYYAFIQTTDEATANTALENLPKLTEKDLASVTKAEDFVAILNNTVKSI